MDDVEALAELFNRVSTEIIGYADFSTQELSTDLTTTGFDLQKDTCVVINPEGQIVAYQDVFATDPIPVHPMVWGRVHPDYLNLGLGTYLIRWGIQRAHHVLDKVPSEARVAVRSFTESQWKPSIELFEAHSYHSLRHYFQMKIKMESTPPKPQWSEGITIENCLLPEGLEDFYRVFDESFEDHFGHVEQPFEQAFEQWKHHSLNDEGHDPSLWFQAKDGEQIAGICLGRKWGWQSKEHGHIRLLGVRRPWRKRGLGLAFLHHMFNVYWERGQHTVTLGVDANSLTGAVRLYEKAGMEVYEQRTVYELELRPGIDLSKNGIEE
jgi:ribosomal protein S18 acetylase RimI-like enzyme